MTRPVHEATGGPTLPPVSRRTALALLAGSGASLVVACRATPAAGEPDVIRAWFREHHAAELGPDSIAAVQAYLAQSIAVSDVAMQPPLLFDPEVDLG